MGHPFIAYRIIIFFLLSSFFSLQGQDYLANVQFYNSENGLAGQFANCTFKDSRGLVWIGTQFGLNRFDGRDFLLFNEASGLPFNQVMEIHEDSEGWLWLFRNCVHKRSCTRNLAFLHSITHEVRTFEEHFGNQLNFEAEEILSIVTNETGDVFLSAKKQIIQWSKGKIKQKIDLPDWENTPVLLKALEGDKLAGWHNVNDENGEACFKYSVFDFNGKILYAKILPNPHKITEIHSIHLIGGDSKNRQMLGYDWHVGVAHEDLVLQQTGELQKDTSDWANLLKPHPLYYNPFRPHAWHIFNENLHVYKPAEGLVYNFGAHFPELDRTFFIRDIRFDENDVTWLSGRQGIYRIQFKPNPFQRILYNPLSDLESQYQYICQGIVPIEKGILFLITQGGMFEKVIADHTSNVNLKLNEKNFTAPITLTKGWQNDFWAMNNQYLVRIKKTNGFYERTLRKFESKQDFSRVVSQYFKNNRLWLGTEKGLHYFDHSQEQFFELADYGAYEELKESYIHQIYEENENRLWLCSSTGLYLFSTKKGIQERYWEGGIGQFKIPRTSFYQIQPARQGGWWLASQQGLVYWNPSKNETQLWTTKEGLVSNEILMVHEDDYGFLWLATNLGLVQFQINTGLSKVWLEADGISSHDFEPYSYYCQNDGTVWFGTTNGYTVFHPKDFKDIDFNEQPDIPLNILEYEQFSIETGQLENRTSELLQSKKIILRPGEQLFNLRVALADYVTGKDAQYAYRIKGFQEFWQEGKENLIRISGLPYGNFELEIRGKLANGQYSSQEIHLPIQVLRPFYLQTWFLIALGILIIGGAYFGYQFRVKQLTKRQTELEQEVENRTETIQKQSEELLEMDKLKSRFFANVSHELRTPLTLMLGPTGSLMKRGYLNEKDQKLLEYIYNNEKHLLGLVNEILDLSKLETNRLQVNETAVNFYEFLKPLVAQFKSFGDSEEVRFEFDYHLKNDLHIFLDKGKFEKIINNFLSNAMKFTPAKGEVKLIVEEIEENILIKVKDNGSGIHPDDLPHIFERFFQSKQPNAVTQGGTGIGLSLCMELAQLLGGKVWAESEFDKGSIFYFEFPKKEAEHTLLPIQEIGETPYLSISKEYTQFPIPQSKIESTSIASERPRILVVEDNFELRDYLQIILEEHYEVLTAENGKMALEILAASLTPKGEPLPAGSEPETENKKLASGSSPLVPIAIGRGASGIDLIISDLMMPIMDGFQLLEKVKSRDQWRHLPFIMLTARADIKVKLRALRIGVDDYMVKPFEEDELLARVKNLLKNAAERKKWILEAEPDLEEEEESLTKIDSSKKELEWLEEVEILVNKHFENPDFNTQKLSELIQLSRTQLFRRIKKITGLSPSEYIKEARYDKARQLLENKTYDSVKAVSYSVGLRHLGKFSIHYKDRFGKTPSAYL